MKQHISDTYKMLPYYFLLIIIKKICISIGMKIIISLHFKQYTNTFLLQDCPFVVSNHTQ
jgi:hypothetical protein